MDENTLMLAVGVGLFLLYLVTHRSSTLGVPILGGGPSVPAPMPARDDGSPGTPSNPIVAMSSDPAQIALDIRASLAYFGRTDDDYWFSLESHTTGPFSNGWYCCGHNKYWEDRMDPTNPGAADPGDAALPAVHRA